MDCSFAQHSLETFFTKNFTGTWTFELPKERAKQKKKGRVGNKKEVHFD